jgi:hypothetical protein
MVDTGGVRLKRGWITMPGIAWCNSLDWVLASLYANWPDPLALRGMLMETSGDIYPARRVFQHPNPAIFSRKEGKGKESGICRGSRPWYDSPVRDLLFNSPAASELKAFDSPGYGAREISYCREAIKSIMWMVRSREEW